MSIKNHDLFAYLVRYTVPNRRFSTLYQMVEKHSPIVSTKNGDFKLFRIAPLKKQVGLIWTSETNMFVDFCKPNMHFELTDWYMWKTYEPYMITIVKKYGVFIITPPNYRFSNLELCQLWSCRHYYKTIIHVSRKFQSSWTKGTVVQNSPTKSKWPVQIYPSVQISPIQYMNQFNTYISTWISLCINFLSCRKALVC